MELERNNMEHREYMEYKQYMEYREHMEYREYKEEGPDLRMELERKRKRRVEEIAKENERIYEQIGMDK